MLFHILYQLLKREAPSHPPRGEENTIRMASLPLRGAGGVQELEGSRVGGEAFGRLRLEMKFKIET